MADWSMILPTAFVVPGSNPKMGRFSLIIKKSGNRTKNHPTPLYGDRTPGSRRLAYICEFIPAG